MQSYYALKDLCKQSKSSSTCNTVYNDNFSKEKKTCMQHTIVYDYGFTRNLQCTGFRGGDGTAVGAIFKVLIIQGAPGAPSANGEENTET